MQHSAVYLLFCKFTLHVSGVNHNHQQLATLDGGSCTAPETVVTVLCTPDDGRG